MFWFKEILTQNYSMLDTAAQYVSEWFVCLFLFVCLFDP